MIAWQWSVWVSIEPIKLKSNKKFSNQKTP
jgi:hypothetical protein